MDTLIANKGKVSFTIPQCIASGQYLLRHEIIGTLFFCLLHIIYSDPFPRLLVTH